MVEPSERSVELILPTCPPQDEGATHHLVDLRPPYLKMWDGRSRCRWLLRVRELLSLEGARVVPLLNWLTILLKIGSHLLVLRHG